MASAFIGRQPIYNRNQQVMAYQLSAHIVDASDTVPPLSASLLIKKFGGSALHALIGEQLAYIQYQPDLILENDPFPDTPGQIVISIDAATPLNTLVCEGLKGLREQGYKIGLEVNSPTTQVTDLLPLVDILRVNTQTFSSEQLAQFKKDYAGFSGQILAAKVDSWPLFSSCHELGFDYFHGHFFCRPEEVRGRKLPANRMTTMRLLAQLNSPEVELGELETIISQDVSLSYRLLRHLNSAFFGLGNKIDSIRHAVALLGLRNLKVWSSIILLAKIDDKPIELMKTALIRAKMCEQLASRTKMAVEDSAFMVGLLSTLEALLDLPIDAILEELPLSEEIQLALTQRQGALGEILDCTLSYEEADWDRVLGSPIENTLISKSYFIAIQWAEETLNEIRQGEG